MKLKINWKDFLERVGKTFIEGFIGSLVTNLAIFQLAFEAGEEWKMAAISLVIGAVAAGISAVWNGVIDPWLQKNKELHADEINPETELPETEGGEDNAEA